MKVLVCEYNSSGTCSTFKVRDCLGNLFAGSYIADIVSEKITCEEQTHLIGRQLVWSNYSEQMTEGQKSFKNCTMTPKKETPPIYGNRWSFDQKTKSCPNKTDMNRLKSYKSSKLLLYKIIFRKSF